MTQRVCKRFLISGRVQGVFFRGSTAQQAAQLELVGFARNLADGRVEVVALGEAAAVESLEQWLAKGPPVARVDRIAVSCPEPDEYSELVDFRTG